MTNLYAIRQLNEISRRVLIFSDQEFGPRSVVDTLNRVSSLLALFNCDIMWCGCGGCVSIFEKSILY